ncbi:hypothetical protein MNBD_GAMMA07-1652 [hydrothermal vent metagenome]|uniref:N-acetyltransferase domain-containing protein n=1 Tax=hydrothermal vent metagenome TaxID=652676 RepID=A0A3B0WSS8_9ZZZZ
MQLISLRSAIQSDKSFVDNLTREVMGDFVDTTWADNDNREQYYKDNAFKLNSTQIICENTQAIGRITLNEAPHERVIEAIHLVLHAQGKGIGSALLQQVIDEAKKHKKSVSLVVLKSNPAVALYLRLGFKVVNETKERFSMKSI